jgi:phage protein D
VLVLEEDENKKDQLYFGPSQSIGRPPYKLTWGKSLIQFQPNLTTANQVGKVRVVGWDPKSKKKIEHTATLKDIEVKDVGGEGGKSGLDPNLADKEEVVTDQPVESKAEAKRLAEERLTSITKDRIKGSGSTVGTPDLRAGTFVQIEGLGERFSGKYFVTATTHTIGDSGYTTQFQCRREET